MRPDRIHVYRLTPFSQPYCIFYVVCEYALCSPVVNMRRTWSSRNTIQLPRKTQIMAAMQSIVNPRAFRHIYVIIYIYIYIVFFLLLFHCSTTSTRCVNIVPKLRSDLPTNSLSCGNQTNRYVHIIDIDDTTTGTKVGKDFS